MEQCCANKEIPLLFLVGSGRGLGHPYTFPPVPLHGRNLPVKQACGASLLASSDVDTRRVNVRPQICGDIVVSFCRQPITWFQYPLYTAVSWLRRTYEPGSMTPPCTSAPSIPRVSVLFIGSRCKGQPAADRTCCCPRNMRSKDPQGECTV